MSAPPKFGLMGAFGGSRERNVLNEKKMGADVVLMSLLSGV
ncbi:MAG: hypothetical protein ABJQ14_01125 [Hyphomicrobiales bacterium]